MFFFVVVIAALLGPATPATDSGLRSASELYFKAHALGDGNYIRQAFTSGAKIFFIENGVLKQWTGEEFAERRTVPLLNEYRRVRRVETVDVRGDAAMAVVTPEYPQVLFRDHLSPPGGSAVVDARDAATGKLRTAEIGCPGERYVLSGSFIELGDLLASLATLTGATAPTKKPLRDRSGGGDRGGDLVPNH